VLLILTYISEIHLRSQRTFPHVSICPQQRRTFLVQLKRQSQTLKENTSTITPPPSAANLQLTNLPYFVRRTPSNQLPVYLVTKAGGTKQQTKIQKTEGDLDSLRNDLARYLGLESGDPKGVKSSDITVNRLNGHIVVKVCFFLRQVKFVCCGTNIVAQGWRKNEIITFLLERNF
jgi:large subunit ribosomal protein L49